MMTNATSHPWLLAGMPGSLAMIALAIAVVAGLGTTLWQIFGASPRRGRIYKRSQRHLHEGDWEQAELSIRALCETGPLPAIWEGRVTNTQGECFRLAGDMALRSMCYEEAVDHFVASA